MLPYISIALVIAFIATCFSFNPREEIAILGTIIALISVFISCTLAPLVIQLLVVIVAWWGIKSICRSSNNC
ncbi:MAG: hypothetical protein AB4368_32535 [Xenococcaceae cyanobacterium]